MRQRKDHPCKWCGRSAPRKRLTCSDVCASASRRRTQSEQKRGKSFGGPPRKHPDRPCEVCDNALSRSAARHGVRRHRGCIPLGPRLVPSCDLRACDVCGHWCVPPRKSLCSNECAAARYRTGYPELRERARERYRVLALSVCLERECDNCGLVYQVRSMTGSRLSYRPRFCSIRCQNTNARERRKMRLRGVRVERVIRARVYDRDDWRCGICGQLVPRDVVVPHPLAPTLDHIQPVAHGGAHSYANVRLAHFLCNSRRGADRGLLAA